MKRRWEGNIYLLNIDSKVKGIVVSQIYSNQTEPKAFLQLACVEKVLALSLENVPDRRLAGYAAQFCCKNAPKLFLW